MTFRDLNHNGTLDPYEDPARPIEERVDDLLGQMTLAEKAGQMFHPMGTLPSMQQFMAGRASVPEMLAHQAITNFCVFGTATTVELAAWTNTMQRKAEATRLGIPISFSSDPRHGFVQNPGTGFVDGAFSQWPEPIGLGATGDVAIVEQFGRIARTEYRATGIHIALHPMADLATEPRWGRISGTFGEDAGLVAAMVGAYIRGFQGETLGPESVACMTKHFPGGGPQRDGEDPHFPYGRAQVYPGGNFEGHLVPFEAAFAAHTAQIMPYYGMPVGTELEEVGFAFNKQVITGMLRERYGFDGVICADWGVLNDNVIMGRTLPARAWGVEQLSVAERARKALDAGVDQFGGESCPEVIVQLVEQGQVTESRLDISVRRILRDKFRLGLFDNPYVDETAARSIVGQPEFRAAGERAQRRSLVLLKNGAGANPLLPVSGRPRIFAPGLDPAVVSGYGSVAGAADAADIAVLRVKAPFEHRDNLPLETFFHSGRLHFTADELEPVLATCRAVPTVVDIFLERPAVIPEIAGAAAALIGSFGSSDAAILDLVFGRVPPEGNLPFELPSSEAAVAAQCSDLPHDSERPLYPFGFGLRY